MKCRQQKYLVILRIIKFLKRDHDELLFVTNNKQDLDQINKINLCDTYFIETKGMTSQNMIYIENKFKSPNI